MLSEKPLPTNDSEENARLQQALRESELLRDLSALLASSLDPTRTLQVLVRRTTEVCQVTRCAVWLLDDLKMRLVPSAYHLSTQHVESKIIAIADRMWHHSSLPLDTPIVHQLLQKKGLLFLEDLNSEPGMHDIAEKFFVHSVLLVALVREGRPVGMMSLDNIGKSCSFLPEQKQLARAIGQQAAVAIDNAHLYQQAQAEHRHTELLIERAQSIYEVAMAVNSDEDLPTVLEIAIQHLLQGLGAQNGAIALLKKDTLTLAHTTPPSSPTTPHTDFKTLHSCQSAAKQMSPLFINTNQCTPTEQAWFQQLHMDEVLIIPLMAGNKYTQNTNTPEKTTTTPKRCIGFIFVNYPQTKKHPTTGHYAFAQDIAEQCALAIAKAYILAEAQQAAALANERANTLAAVFNAMTEGIVVQDMTGQVIMHNETAPLLIDLPAQDHHSLTTYLHTHQVSTIYGQPIDAPDFPLLRALRGEHIRGERFTSSQIDGTERSLEVNSVPLLDSLNQQIGVVSAFRDITEQVRSERRIHRALDTMLHAAEAISGITDIREILDRVLAMTLIALNSERGIVQLYDQETQSFVPLLSSGFSPTELSDWIITQNRWLLPEDARYTNAHTQMMDGHVTLICTELSNPQDGTVQQEIILNAPITHNKKLLGLMSLNRSSLQQKTLPEIQTSSTNLPTSIPLTFSAWDMAVIDGIVQFAGLAMEQSRWQQEAEVARTNEATMRASNELKDEFLAITAHEFRSPLTVILAYSQMMGRTLQKDSEVSPELRTRFEESIFSIEEQTRQLTNIVNTFLEVTLLNKGQINLQAETLNLEDILKESVAIYSTTSPLHSISYKCRTSTHPYMLMGDKARLLQVFANLLQNALKYSPLGGPITVSMTQRKKSAGQRIIEIRIVDKGIGVPLEAQPHLFERFYRASNINNNQTGGIGLGLYVVAEFLHLHGGTIHVESKGIPGEGSHFIVTLPLLITSN